MYGKSFNEFVLIKKNKNILCEDGWRGWGRGRGYMCLDSVLGFWHKNILSL